MNHFLDLGNLDDIALLFVAFLGALFANLIRWTADRRLPIISRLYKDELPMSYDRKVIASTDSSLNGAPPGLNSSKDSSFFPITATFTKTGTSSPS